MIKTCIRCKEEKPYKFFNNSINTKDKKDYYCKLCRKEVKRAEYQKNKERYKNFGKVYRKTERGKLVSKKVTEKMKIKYPEKTKARNLLNASIIKGVIQKPNTCESCTKVVKVCGHHDDYSKPLDVRWLCYPCHTEWHMKNGFF